MKIAGIRFRKAGKIYYFDPNGIEINAGEHVIVETVRGVEYGTVVLAGKEVADDTVVQPLKKVMRLATEEDKEAEVKNKAKEREAYEVCRKKIHKHGLDMKLIDCEYTFDNNKLLFYFTADGRVDFRELVKDLASVFKTRIELRQIGVRDETKMMGSIGICGRTLCCHAHLADFHPVSIKMAKDQSLSLNPTKISGVCGRLMCCLKYEEDTYKELNKNLPRVGEKVRLKSTGQIADVIKTNVIRQSVKLIIRKEDGDPEIFEMKLEELDLKKDGKFAGSASSDKKQPKANDNRNRDKAPEQKQGEKKDGQKEAPKNNEEKSSRNNRRTSNNRNRQSNKNNSGQKQQNNQQKQPASNKDKQGSTKQSPSNRQQKQDKGGNDKKNTNKNRNRRPRNKNNTNNRSNTNRQKNTAPKKES